MSKGIWGNDWYGANISGLSAFAVAYCLAALGSAVNDTMSGIWALINVTVKGELGDFFRTLKSKPGVVMIVCALIGGPLASTAYVAALQMGGSIIVPICALNASFGAIIGHFVFKQAINRRMMAGILLCLIAAGVIGGPSFSLLPPIRRKFLASTVSNGQVEKGVIRLRTIRGLRVLCLLSSSFFFLLLT